MTSVAYRFLSDPPLRALDGKFSKAKQALIKKRRDELRSEMRRLTRLMQDEAPGRQFPRGIRFRTFEEGGQLRGEIRTPQPLGTFIIEGTRSHPITPKRAKALRFFTGTSIPGFGIEPSGLSGAIFATKVQHPGTAPNRFHGRAVRRWKPGARAALRRMAVSYTDALQ